MTPMSRLKPSSSVRLAILLLSGTALAGLPTASHAQTTWLGTTSNNWFTGTNWSTNAQPSVTTDVIIDTETPHLTVVDGFNAHAQTLVIGKTGAGFLTIQNGGLLSVAGNVVLAQTLGSTGSIILTGTGSSFSTTNNGGLHVGQGGDGGFLIENGATASVSGDVIIEHQNGVVGLDGFGSSLTVGSRLEVGQNGGGQLTIQNGASATADGLEVDEGGVATITGTESQASATIRTLVGDDGSGQLVLNQTATGHLADTYISGDWHTTVDVTTPKSGTLAVSTGATATSTLAEVGEFANHTGAVTVDGTGSSWTITSGLSIGDNGGTGTLAITNGGLVTAGVTVIGTQDGTGSLTLNSGGVAHTGETALGSGAGGAGTLIVSGANSAYSTDVLEVGVVGSGTVSVQTGAIVTANNLSIADDTGATGSATVTGSGAALAVNQTLSIDSGTGTFSVLGGAHVSDNLGIIGQFNGVDATATVAGVGSQWTNNNTLSIGKAGTGALTITNGGVVGNIDSDLGGATTASGTVTVSGAGSQWNTTGQMTVGDQGSGSLSLASGATVSANGLNLAQMLGTHGTASIDGAGSVLTVAGAFYDGARGFGTLTISNGGAVSDLTGFVAGAGGSTATATVSGTNSTWDTTDQLTIGGGLNGGNSDGTLTISAGGLVADGSAELGELVGSTGRIVIDGTNSHWLNANDVVIGDSGTGSMVVSHGGFATADNFDVGVVGSGTVTVTGAGSHWLASGEIYLGGSPTSGVGTGTLSILNGGLVNSVDGLIANSTVQTNGAVTIDGAGSTWAVVGNIIVGGFGTGSMLVSNGGLLSDDIGAIGAWAGGHGTANVVGAGATWTGANLDVGVDGTGKLILSSGGTAVATTSLNIGVDAGSAGTLVIGADAVDAAASPGTVTSPGIVFGSGQGTVVFNHTSSNYVFAPQIIGTGTIDQVAGVTALTGDGSQFNGAVSVQGGTLLVDDTLGIGGGAASVFVQSGGRLGGTGSLVAPVSIAGGGTLIGIQGQTLIMDSLVLGNGAHVDVSLGAPGGAVLFDINHDLTLDGTLDVHALPGFGPGIYRLMTYFGTLNDQGLSIGTVPGGTQASDYAVQTSVPFQVNLVDLAVSDLAFWDGDAAGSANNHIVDGGAGTWSVTSGNWTDVNGATNGAMSPQPGFAVFEGAPGLVTVDGSAGTVAVDGMQFAVDGYHVAGASIALADPASMIRVGDGTSAGAGYTATIGSALVGTGGLVKSDLGTLVLTGANTYAGDTDVLSGVLQLDAGGSLSNAGGTLYIAGNASDPAGSAATTNLTNGGAIGAMQSIVIGAPVNSTGVLQVSGSGSTATAGQIEVGQGGMGSLFLLNGAVVTAPTATVGVATGSNGAVVVDGTGSQWLTSGVVTIADQGTGALTLQNGGVAGATTAIIGAQGVGTVIVSDPTSHWQIGGDIVVGGTETTGAGTGNLSVLGQGLVTSTNGLIGASAGSNGAVIVSGTNAGWTLSGTLGVGWVGAGTLAVRNGGLLSDNVGGIGVTGAGLGVALVDGAGSIWSSPTLEIGVNGSGTFLLSDGGVAVTSLGTQLAVNAGSTAMLIIGGDPVGPAADPGILTSPTLTFGAGQGSLDFNHTSANYVFSAAMSGTGVIDQYAGTTHLTGDSNGFQGGATVLGGTLLVDGRLGLGAVTVVGGALGGSGTIAGPVTVTSGGILVGTQGQVLTMDSLALNTGATVNVTLNAPGGTALFDISHDLVLGGALNVTAGTGFGPGLYRLMTYGGALTDNGLMVASISDGTPTSDFSVQTSVAGQVNLVDASPQALPFWDGDASGNAANNLVDGGSGTWRVTGTNWTDVNGSANGPMTPQPGFAIFEGAPGTVTVDDTAGTVAVTGMQFANTGYVVQGDAVTLAAANAMVRVGDGTSAGAGYSATIGSVLTGAGGLTKADLGTLVLTGENTFAGATTITAGTLQLGNGSAGGTGSVAGDIVDNAALVFDNGALLHNTAGTISGSGSVSVLGLVDLTGTNTYSGGTTVANTGTLFIGSSSTTGRVVGDIADNGRVGFARSDSLVFAGVISGTGSVEQDGNGTLTLTGANTYTDGTTINEGVLQLGNGGTTGAIVGDVSNAGTLAFDRSDAVTFDGVISGSGSVVQAGTGTMTLTGVNTYGGGTSITGGTLVGQATSFGSGGIDVQSTLVLDQATNGVLTNVISGNGALTKQGAGILTLTGASTISGATTIAAGGLSVDGALDASAITVQSGASLGGKGSVGNVTVADGGTLIGVQGQSLGINGLILGAGAKLDVSLTSPGGAALFDVKHDVVLDGTLDISSPSTFGPGVYRLMTYGGSLTDDGLVIGATPANTSAADLAVQTAVSGQVNLVDTVSAPVTLQFWDGDASGSANNHAIDGGSGTWSVASANWTDINGAVNGAQAPQPGFAIFEGAPGTVIVDDTAGPVSVTGMQFAGTGYVIQGNAISLSDPNTVIRVGDGTSAGAGYVATIASVLTGAGGVDKTDLGTLVLSGVNTYSGDTTISGGTLVGPVASFGTGAIHDNAALIIDQATDAVFANTLDGTGAFTKRGGGSLDYTGTGTLTGPTTVAAGRLAVNGSLQASQVTVQNGATLGGNGTVGGIVVQSGGIVAPGNSIGQLTVAGNYAQANGSIYQAQVASTGQNDRIVVSGSATLAAGAVLDVIKTDTSPFVTGTHYTLLSAAGGVTGTYALTGDVTPTTFSTVVLDYDAHDVYLDITKTASFASAGTTANEKATGGGLDSLTSGNPLYTAIMASPDTAAAAAAFDQLSGEIHASVRTTLVENSRIVRDMALGRLTDGLSQDRGEGMWGEAVGSTGTTDSDGNAAKLSRSTDGLIMGFQHGFDNATQLGLLAGYTRTDMKVAARRSSGTIDSYHLGGYWGVERGPVNIRLGADYAWQVVDVRRGVAFAGFADQLKSNTSANTAEAFADIGYRLGSERAYLEPYLQAVEIDARTQAVYEQGGYAALSADRATTDLGLATVGVRGAAQFRMGAAETVLHGGIGWQDALNAKAPADRMAFSGSGPFDIAGAPIAQDAVTVDAGVDVKVAQRLKLKLTYSGQLAAHAQDNAVKAGFNWRF